MADSTLWLHLMGIVLSLGASVLLIVGIYPAAQKIEDAEQRFQMLASILKYFHPLYLFGICLVFMSGAIGLTDLKIGLGTGYYEKISGPLMIKFGFTMMIFLIASMQCFGQGLKVTRMANGIIEADRATKDKYINKIKRATMINIVLIAITIYYGLQLGHAVAAN